MSKFLVVIFLVLILLIIKWLHYGALNAMPDPVVSVSPVLSFSQQSHEIGIIVLFYGEKIET